MFHKTESEIIKNQEICFQKKLNYSFSDTFPLDDMQRWHHLTKFSQQAEKQFSRCFFNKPCTAEVILESKLNLIRQF